MKTDFETLSQRLGVLDKERRNIILKLKNTPNYALQHLKQVLGGFMSDNSTKWYSRTNEKNEMSYFKLVSFEIIPTTTTVKKGYIKTKISAPIDIKNNSVLTKIKLNWEFYNYGSVIKDVKIEEINISIFNDIEPQILNGRKPVVKFNEKKLVAAALLEKKKTLEDELKKVKCEIALIDIK